MGWYVHGGWLRGWQVSARLRGVCGRVEIIRHILTVQKEWRVVMEGYFPLHRRDGNLPLNQIAVKCPPT